MWTKPGRVIHSSSAIGNAGLQTPARLLQGGTDLWCHTAIWNARISRYTDTAVMFLSWIINISKLFICLSVFNRYVYLFVWLVINNSLNTLQESVPYPYTIAVIVQWVPMYLSQPKGQKSHIKAFFLCILPQIILMSPVATNGHLRQHTLVCLTVSDQISY